MKMDIYNPATAATAFLIPLVLAQSAAAQTVSASDQVGVEAEVAPAISVSALGDVDLGTLVQGDAFDVLTSDELAAEFDIAGSHNLAWQLEVLFEPLDHDTVADQIAVVPLSQGDEICFDGEMSGACDVELAHGGGEVTAGVHGGSGIARIGYRVEVPATAAAGRYANQNAIVLHAEVSLN